MNNLQAIPHNVQSTLKCSYSKPEGKKIDVHIAQKLKNKWQPVKNAVFIVFAAKAMKAFGTNFYEQMKGKEVAAEPLPSHAVTWWKGDDAENSSFRIIPQQDWTLEVSAILC